jgi:hypothetical protein
MGSFWLNDPGILVRGDQLTILWPTSCMSVDEQLNALTRFIIVAAILGYALTSNRRFVLVGICTVVAVAAYQKALTPKVQEGFTESTVAKMAESFTVPTKKNPLMNVLLPEINGNPNRRPAMPHSPETDELINATFKKDLDPRLFKGINDEMDFESSMRTFYTTANTTIPDDGFREYLMHDLISTKTAKEGDPTSLGRYKPRLGSLYH